MDEAAKLDGAGHIRIFFQVLLPLMKPAIGTCAVFTFIWTWNDFFSQLLYLTKPDMYTVPIALRTFIDSQSQSSYGPMFAMSVVSLIPLFLVFTFGQKYLVQGIATTGEASDEAFVEEIYGDCYGGRGRVCDCGVRHFGWCR